MRCAIPRDGRNPGRGIPAAIAAALLLVALATGASTDAPLTAADVVRFLRAGISERTILSEVRERGFVEVLDDLREAAVREAGASETLVAALRGSVPSERGVPPPPAPPGPLADPFATARGSARAPTFGADTRTVRVPVSVLDKSGQPVLGLKSEDFRVSDDGRRQVVTLFSGERRALRIALALDLSRSMEGKIRQVEEALRHFIDLLEPADEILVITFNSEVHVVQDFTSDRELLGRVLDMLEPAGSTALYDAAAEAIRRVAPGPAESKAVVLVTDGVDTASTISLEALRELARRSEVPVFSIGLDSGSEPGHLSRPGRRGGGPRGPGVGGRGGWPGGGGPGWGSPGGGRSGPGGMRRAGFDGKPLLELADDTGGRAETVRGREHYTPGGETADNGPLKAAVESIALTLRHRYLLGYEPPEGKRGWRAISVDVDRPATTARARKGYYTSAGG